ncbi:protein-disulfide isomerase [Alcanivorax sp. N3-2A]|nr:protein-disulfide isomerase [Alcanivorax sp. N3-2A]|tara:strand:- start:2657 stop:3388 length:732 start_codon:yes stop_codon:yes gene_type:complete
MKRILLVGMGLLVAGMALAAGKIDEKALKAAFAKSFPQFQVTSIKPAAVDGMAMVELNGREVVYASDDGRFIFTGDLIELRDEGPVNLNEERLQTVRAEGLAKIDPKTMITYPAEGKQKAEIYAFTDITCGYCRKLHRHIEQYTAEGITVHYLAFPRGGPDSQSAKDMRHIWCDAKPAEALTAAKLTNAISEAKLGECAESVDREYQMGINFGVRGTPAIYSPDGVQLGGYVTPEQLNQRLGL